MAGRAGRQFQFGGVAELEAAGPDGGFGHASQIEGDVDLRAGRCAQRRLSR